MDYIKIYTVQKCKIDMGVFLNEKNYRKNYRFKMY